MFKAALIMLIIGLLLGTILYTASILLAVKNDERIDAVTKMLPGYNCGSCGYPGCSGMAQALVKKETDTLACRPAKPDVRKAIVDYLANTPGPDGETIKIKSI